jgi:superfamily II DNA/RNA helicase
MQTLAFLLPVMTAAIRRLEERVESKAGDAGPEAIIVSPSRELAMQTVRVAHRLLPKEAQPLVQQAIGGANMRRQLEAIKRNRPLCVIGTPGRLADLSRQGCLRTHKTTAVVLDEVDQLLCHQFRDDLHRIMQHLGSKLPNGPQIVRPACSACPAVLASALSVVGHHLEVSSHRVV